MTRVIIFLLGLFAPSVLLAQVLNPQSGVALRYQRAQLKGNSLLLTTYQPYLVELEASTLTPIRTVQIDIAFRPQEFYRISDSVIYAWSPTIGIPPNNSNPILVSQDGGVNWSHHTNLRTTSGQLSFIDSNFIIDGIGFLDRYTLDGGQAYLSPNAANYEIAGIHDSGAYLYQAQSDSLWNLSRAGLQLFGILDTSFQSLRHLYQTSLGYIALSDSGAIVELDANLHYLSMRRQIQSGLYTRGQFFGQNDTVALVWGDSIYYSQNAGLSWSSGFLPSLDSYGTFNCLALVKGELLFANGSGALAGFSLKDGSARFIGGNDYPLVNDLLPYSNGFYALNRNNVVLAGRPRFQFHQMDLQGKLLRTIPLPFLDQQVFPHMVVLDSLKIILFSTDSVYESEDGGLSWSGYANQGVVSIPIARKAEKDSAVFLYEWDNTGPYLSKWTFGGLRTRLNFNFSLSERVLELAFWNSDSGLVFTNEDVYRTVDGGQSFNAWIQGPVPIWHSQWQSDTLLVAARDFNYLTKVSAGGLLPIDSQPILSALFTTFPYKFISETQVVSYIGESSKIAIADSRYSYYREFDLPVDQVNNFHILNNRLYATTAGGGLLAFDLDSLFPLDIGTRQFDPPLKTNHLWPNPVRDRFYIDGPSCDYFLIFNYLGQLVQEGSYDDLDGGRLIGMESGLYYLKGFENDHLVFQTKFYHQ